VASHLEDLTRQLRAWFDYPRAVQPSVAADGNTVYFISDREGHPEAWQVPRTGGPPRRLFSSFERVGRVQPSPTGPRLVVASDIGGDEHWALTLWEADGTGPRALTHVPGRIHEPGAWRDGRNYLFRSNERDVRFFDIYEVDLERTDPPRCIREEDALLGVAAARGDRVLLVRSRTNIDTDLILRTDSRETLLNPRSSEQAVFDADLARDGVYAASNPDREYAALVRYPFSGTTPELVHEFPGDVERVGVDRAGNRVALVTNDRGWSRLFVADLGTGERVALPIPYDGVVSTVAWAPDGSQLYFDLSGSRLGSEIFRYDLGSREVRPVTAAARPMPGTSVDPTLHEFRASDGLTVPYWEFRPIRPPRGTVIVVHGGPESQARPMFSPLTAFLVDLGFRLVVPNVRGSLGYGRTYLHLDDVRRRMDSVRDLRELVDRVQGTGPGTRRLGIIGASYGGFMVLSAISTYPELWAAAVDVVGIANFITFLERTGPWRRKVREDEYGSLERDRDFLRSISPLHQADRIRAPLLVVHGANDPRVPVYEAEQIVDALRRREVPVEFLRFDDEGHGLVRRENQVRAYARAAEFFERYLAPNDGA
jgi:protease II